jgi:hypothetical protein
MTDHSRRSSDQPLGERIAALETQNFQQEQRLERMEVKLDQLLTAANMGRGAWWLLLKLGGLLALVAAAVAWVWQHVKPVLHP